MALSSTSQEAVEKAKASIEEWRDKETARIQSDADFLKLTSAPLKTLSTPARESATDDAETLVDSILGA